MYWHLHIRLLINQWLSSKHPSFTLPAFSAPNIIHFRLQNSPGKVSISEGHCKHQGKSQLELPFPDPIYPQPQDSTYREQPSTVYYYKETNSDTTNKPDHPKTMLPDMQTKAEVREQRSPTRLSSSRRSDVSSAELIDSVLKHL